MDSLDEDRRKRREKQDALVEQQALRRFIDKEVERIGGDVRQGLNSVGAGVAWAGFWLALGLVALAIALAID